MSYEEIPPDVVTGDNTVSIDHSFKFLDTVIALYDFPGTQPSHLPLDLGDTVYVLTKNDSGWWDGIVSTNGEMCRGWFPQNYVRLVNYVQPVLNKLKSNKEIDLITAANTAANVLIPSFTRLLQRNLADSGKNSPTSNTRKNSVVSFASLETSIPLDSKKLTTAWADTSVASSGATTTVHQPLVASTISLLPGRDSFSARVASDGDLTPFTPVEEAEAMALEYKKTLGKNVFWLPRITTSGDVAYYCEALNIFCESLPLVQLVPLVDVPGGNVDVPSKEAIDDTSVVARVNTNGEYHDEDSEGNSRSNSSIGKGFDTLKRDSSASSMSRISSASSYHHFLQPFFITPNLFYKHFTDLTYWTELREQFNYLLDLTWKALKDSNKQLFGMHLSRLTKVVSIVMSAARLVQDDFVGSKYERSVRRKLRRVSEAFSQMYINGLLHLSVMHYSQASSSADLFSLDIRSLNKSTSTPTTNLSDASSHSRNSNATIQGPRSSVDNRESQSPGLSASEDPIMSYLLQIDLEVETVRANMNGLIKVFLKLSKGKKVSGRDYDSSDASEGESEDRYNVLPQVYPRFISDEFNGGNWCNPFFTSMHSFLNLSGDHLKNKYHLKVILDAAAFDSSKKFTDEIIKISKDTLSFLDPEAQLRYYNEDLRNERNDQILRLVYRYLHLASSLIDLLESFDFTVFCLIKRYTSAESVSEGNENENNEPVEPTSNLTFDYPVVLEFFQCKQHFHDLISNIVMYTQALTLEDPDVFTAMKEDNSVFYNREGLKNPLEKSSILLLNILTQQSTRKGADSIVLNPDEILSDLLKDGIEFGESMLGLVQQLVDERETILNYATRVMHDDFNVELLVIERNNTVAGEKQDDNAGHYYSGKKAKNDDIPWYLEGDEEYDLLLDVKGNIKGGTKEALVAHLTHHETLDGAFNSAFLITFSTIMPIAELIQILINRFNMEAPEGLSYAEYLTWKLQKQARIRYKVLDVMKLILENHWCKSFYNVGLLERWLAFVKLPAVKPYQPGSKNVADDIELVLQGEMLVKEPEPVIVRGKVPAPILKSFSLKKMKLQDIDYLELARQLTVREFELYRSISKLSCIHKVWGKRSGLNESIETITSFIKASNQLTNFVAYMILRKDEARKRVQVIRYFVMVAEKCRQYNNFSSMTAIISALYSSPIHRLKKTWAYVSRDTMAQLQSMNKLMNSTRNFNEYRDMLRFIGSEPCVPFFGVYLSDLTFIYHGNPDHLLNRTKMINFAKRAKTVDIVMGIDRFKRVGYNFQTVKEIQNYLDLWFDKCPTIEEQYQLSLNLEPREQADRRPSKTTPGTQTNTGILSNAMKQRQPMNVLGIR